MAANQFEENVQKTLDEFTLRPSAEVWQNVEKRIREKKRTRRIIFFVIFLFLGLALAGYGVYNFSNRQNMTSNVTNKKFHEKEQGTRNLPTGQAGKKQETGNIEKTEANNNTVKTNTEITTSKEPVNNKPLYDKEAVKKPIQRNNDLPPLKQKNSMVTALKKNIGKQRENHIDDTLQQNISPDISSNNDQQASSDIENQKIISTQPNKDIAKNNSRDTASIKGGEGKRDLPSAQVKKTEKRNLASGKLKWGLNFSVGSSTISQNHFSLKDIGNSNDNYSNNPGTSPGGPPGLRNAESRNRSSFAFKAGLTMIKILSKRSSLSMNIDYTYLADKIKIGIRQNGSPQASSSYDISSYYSGVPQEIFKDRFHFLELPIIYDWRITGNTKHFISFDVGTSLSYLVATNALVYDTISGGIYYHHKDLFHKLHANLVSGLSYHFTGGKNLEFNIGPQFSFDINNIFKTDLDRRKYFLYAGLGATIFFDKKKK